MRDVTHLCPHPEVCRELARDLADAHDNHDLSLDTWAAARHFAETFEGPLEENGQ